MAETELRNFTMNFGPQHPAAHGVLRLVLENAAIENDCGRIRYIRDQLPILAFREERFHSKGRAPVKICGWIVAVAQTR